MRDLVLVSTGTDEYAEPYIESLKAAGFPAESLRVVTPDRRAEVPALAARAAGLVLCGGLDVDPARYGEEILPDAGVELFPERDEVEWSLVAAARDAQIPVWGICRGIQVLNVFLGGSLWQDLPTQHPSAVEHSVSQPKDALVHTVHVRETGAGLADVLNRETPRVNSRHHQAVKRLGAGLVPVAESPDGIVEAVELAASRGSAWWVRAVQWHPENLIAQAQQLALWSDFARAVGGT
jgi:gamma-glutamyl-gamma-aminobutyrate hydrolase PuuD